MRSPSQPLFSRAFSLIELLVVVGIIGIIATFAVPAASTIVKGTDLTRGAQQLAAQFSAARQEATSRNHAVELRMVRYADPEAPGEDATKNTTWNFRAFQIMEILPSGAAAQIQFSRLPSSIVMLDDQHSSLLNNAAEPGQTPPQRTTATNYDPPLPRLSSGSGSANNSLKYEYQAFRFLPDGSTDLTQTGKWYVTIAAKSDQTKAATDIPLSTVNYFTQQVDPATGSTRSYRPTAGSH